MRFLVFVALKIKIVILLV